MNPDQEKTPSPDEVNRLRSRIQELERELSLRDSKVNDPESYDRFLFESTGTAMVVVDENNLLSIVNAQFCEMAEMNCEEIEGKIPWGDFIHSEDLVKMKRYNEIRTSQTGNVPRNYEFRFISGKGNLKHILITVGLIPGTRKTLAALNDITELKSTQLALQANHARMRTILEEMPVMMAARDDQNLICAWNKECERVTGWTEEDVLKNPDVDDLFYPDPDYRMKMQQELEIRIGDYRNWEWETACKDGSTKIISWSNLSKFTPIPGWSSWGIGTDMTALREAEEKSRATNDLQVAQRLAAAVAHEFRQPLAGLKIITDLIEMKEMDPDTLENYNERVRNAVDKLDELVGRLLKITQLENRPYAFNVDILDLDKSSTPNSHDDGTESEEFSPEAGE